MKMNKDKSVRESCDISLKAEVAQALIKSPYKDIGYLLISVNALSAPNISHRKRDKPVDTMLAFESGERMNMFSSRISNIRKNIESLLQHGPRHANDRVGIISFSSTIEHELKLQPISNINVTTIGQKLLYPAAKGEALHDIHSVINSLIVILQEAPKSYYKIEADNQWENNRDPSRIIIFLSEESAGNFIT